MKSLILIAFIALCATPQTANAGFFARLFGRGCQCNPCNCGTAKAGAAKPVKKYRYECKNGVCRRVEIE